MHFGKLNTPVSILIGIGQLMLLFMAVPHFHESEPSAHPFRYSASDESCHGHDAGYCFICLVRYVNVAEDVHCCEQPWLLNVSEEFDALDEFVCATAGPSIPPSRAPPFS